MSNKKIPVTEQQRLIRQINYYIIRRLWQHKKGVVESLNKSNDLYQVLGIKRNTYTALVTGNTYRTPRISKEKLAILAKTGLPNEIFEGNKQIEIHNISLDEWKDYFKLRYAGKKSHHREVTLAALNSKLLEEFSVIRTEYSYNSDLCILLYFIETGEEFTGDRSTQYISHCVKTLNDLSFKQWEACEEDDLKEYFKVLSAKTLQIETILNYKRLSK